MCHLSGVFEYKTKMSVEAVSNDKFQEALSLPQLHMISFNISMRIKNTQQHVR